LLRKPQLFDPHRDSSQYQATNSKVPSESGVSLDVLSAEEVNMPVSRFLKIQDELVAILLFYR